MEVYKFSAKGNRATNEDCIYIQGFSDGSSLCLLADGMGGYLYGELAANTACKVIADSLYVNFGKYGVRDLLVKSFNLANKAIWDKRKELDSKMGTTIAGILFINNMAYLIWLGDVRIYYFRKNELIYRSEDHSLLVEMGKRGQVALRDIKRFENIVTRSINGEPFDQELDIKQIELIKGDTFIICSDGLWRNFNLESLQNMPHHELTKQLELNSNNVDDNYSLVKVVMV